MVIIPGVESGKAVEMSKWRLPSRPFGVSGGARPVLDGCSPGRRAEPGGRSVTATSRSVTTSGRQQPDVRSHRAEREQERLSGFPQRGVRRCWDGSSPWCSTSWWMRTFTIGPGGVAAIVRMAYQDDVSSGGATRIDYVT